MLQLYSADRALPLATRLAEVLAEPPIDPFEPEWLAVPSDGMRRWLTLQLAGRLGSSGPGRSDGIAANIQRAFPSDLRSALLSADRPPDAPDPWRIERLVWSVLDVLVRPDQPTTFAEVDHGDGVNSYARARRIADLFDRYHLHRPQMIRYWSEGRAVDEAGIPLADHVRWQATLWQEVRHAVGAPSPPERLPRLLGRLRRGEMLLDVPGRLLFFGFTLLPAGEFLEVARAVAIQRDVHVFLLEPTHLDASELLLASPRPTDGRARLRSADPTAKLVRHPLVRSWGRLHRESALLLADAQASDGPVVRVAEAAPSAHPATLLGRLQSDIRTNAAPLPSLATDRSDHSVQFHACFGATRQVEVLRDALLHLLAQPETELTEDEIVVVCPSLDLFAPLIEAVFGRSADPMAATDGGSLADGRGAPALRYRIADQSVRSTNPVLHAASTLLTLVAGRCAVPDVLDFLALGPVRERFGFDDDGLETIAGWMEQTNVRWGLDPSQRARQGMPASITTNTWRAALDRLLIGSAVHDQGLQLAVGSVAPFGVEGGDIELVGALAEIVTALAGLAEETTRSHPIAIWTDRIRQACAVLFGTAPDTAWQLEALERILAAAVDSTATDARPPALELTFDDLVKLLNERFDERVGRADFFRGGITVTSLTPLRWVPFRVVALLGMDQPAFVADAAAGDDLTATYPQIGDRDTRGEVRESLLEAVLAAEDHLVIVRDGHDVRTNQVIPQAVVTTELYEAVLASVDLDHRAAVAARLEIEHPRQAYDERCFEVDELVEGTPWGFDRDELDGALARRHRSSARSRFLERPIEPRTTDVIALSALHSFFVNPTAAFFSQGLEATVPRAREEAPSTLPLSIGGLEGWRIGDGLLEARVSGASFYEWFEHEQALGTLPPGQLGHDEVATVVETVSSLIDEARQRGMGTGPVEPFPIDVVLPDGTRVVGSVPLLGRRPTPGPVRLYYSRFKASHRVSAWLDLMALLATDPETSWRSVAVSRSDASGRPPKVTDLVVNPEFDIVGDGAGSALAVAVDCFRRGLTEPIPLFPKLSYLLYRGRDKEQDWTGFEFPADGDHPAVRLAFDNSDYETIKTLEVRPGDPPGPQHRAMRFATYLFQMIDRSTRPGPTPSEPIGTPGPGGR